MAKFKTQFDKHGRFFSKAGSKEKQLYVGHYNDDGSFDLIPNGKANIYNEIQSHADSVDIHVILKRYENGDLTALNKQPGFYGDISEFPTNFADLLNIIQSKKDEFMSLNPEVREKFGNDSNRYIATAGSKEWFENLGVKFDNGVVSGADNNSSERVGENSES